MPRSKLATPPRIRQSTPPQKPEEDPNGLPLNSPGAKADKGKNRVGLVVTGFAHALEEVSKVGTFGAEKYTDRGFLEVPDGEGRYTDAMMRHFLQEETVGPIDSESGLLHMACVAWNALARLELHVRSRNLES